MLRKSRLRLRPTTTTSGHVRPYIRVGLAALSGPPGVALVRITATRSPCREKHRASVRDGARGNSWIRAGSAGAVQRAGVEFQTVTNDHAEMFW